MSEPLTDGAFVDWFLGEYGIDPIDEDWDRVMRILAARTPALDVGLLAQALKKWGGPSIDGDGRRTAKTIAREYAALSTPPESVR